MAEPFCISGDVKPAGRTNLHEPPPAFTAAWKRKKRVVTGGRALAVLCQHINFQEQAAHLHSIFFASCMRNFFIYTTIWNFLFDFRPFSSFWFYAYMFDAYPDLQLENLSRLNTNMLATMGYPTDHRMSARTRPRGFKPSSKAKPRPAQSQPVDADELTRRLQVVLAEQRAHSEKKRRARAEAERLGQSTTSSKQKKTTVASPPRNTNGNKLDSSSRQRPEAKSTQNIDSSPKEKKLKRSSSKNSNSSSNKSGDEQRNQSSGYHHIPQVAASQFTLTTTVEPPAEKGPVHKLSKLAMKFHLEGPNASREVRETNPAAPPCEQTKALRRAQSMRERQYERNHVHEPLPTTFEADGGAGSLPHRHTFHTRLRAAVNSDEVKDARRRSTGSILGRNEAPPVEPFELVGALLSSTKSAVIGDPDEHRVDWTQRDEEMAARAIDFPQPSQPELRKHESRWTLRGRLGSFGRHSKDDKPPSPIDEKSPQDLSPKSPISGFFSRFKR